MKNKLRNLLIQKRKCHKSLSRAISKIEKNFFILLKGYKFNNIAGFYPTTNEIDIINILVKAYKRGFRISLPKIIDVTSELVFREWVPGDPLILNQYKIFEPIEECPDITPDLIITPLLGFDRRGYRLGYGKGYYDRTLPKFPDAIKVALCYSFQEVKELPCELHDQPVDYIITEQEIIKCAK